MIYPKSHGAKRKKTYFQTKKHFCCCDFKKYGSYKKKKKNLPNIAPHDQKPKILVTETPHHHKPLMRNDMKYSSCPPII